MLLAAYAHGGLKKYWLGERRDRVFTGWNSTLPRDTGRFTRRNSMQSAVDKIGEKISAPGLDTTWPLAKIIVNSRAPASLNNSQSPMRSTADWKGHKVWDGG